MSEEISELELRLEEKLAEWDAKKTPEEKQADEESSIFLRAWGELYRNDKETYLELQGAMNQLIGMGYLFEFIMDSYKRIKKEYTFVKGTAAKVEIHPKAHPDDARGFYDYELFRGDKKVADFVFRKASLGYEEVLDKIFKYEYKEGKNEL